MKIQPQPSNIIITFSPNDYCLMKCKDEMLGDYALHYLIDRSDKGKGPEAGMEVLYLTHEQAAIFKKSGFSEFHL